jgi:flagellar basal-body rod protein FlgF
MENTLFVALSRQVTLRRQMDVVANNIANMNTTGFKGEKMMFVEHLVRSKGANNILGEKLNYVRDIATVRDTTKGHINQTNNPLDLALVKDGYFVIETQNGEQFTRNGRFQLDATGQLVNQTGEAVLSSTGQPFFFGPTDTDINIASDGTVSTENGSLGRLRVVTFDSELDLKQSGAAMFTTTNANPPTDIEIPTIIQGALENSNVQPIIEITKMITVSRQYDGIKNFINKEDERQKNMIKELMRSV